MCDSRMERTLDNRPPSVFCLILKSQNLTETLQIEIRDIMIALPLKAYMDCIWCDVCVYAQNCCFICGRTPVLTQSVGHISSHINLFCQKYRSGTDKSLDLFWQ